MVRKDHGVTEMDLINTDTYSRPVQVARSKSAAISNEIAFSIGESALGKVFVARSAGGVCAILIGSDTDELSNDLATRFPDNRLIADEQQLPDRAVANACAANAIALGIPCHPRVR